ncbi:hypothetical protein BBF96_08850 [Anoxybacter fermentans]|uniref:Uncharacterized protein n=1 Tax=Anoxybacter fermentans TaxID=1323375 RepID=A0A3S9SYV6_9FIRM|nr:hypothetical protein [Anoxybacter fermentans]AZR73481.1 hypothetical protein BBF96_08850 [Anoxybacter fermentans]
MKKYIIIILSLLISNYCFADDVEPFEVIKQFEMILKSNNLDETIDLVVVDKELRSNIYKFLKKYIVLKYNYSIERIKKINTNNYKIELKNELHFRKKNGFIKHILIFNSTFILSRTSYNSAFKIKVSDFFDEIYFTEKTGYFLLTFIIVIPAAIHAMFHKKKKWVYIIFLFNLIGVILYYMYEIKKSNKNNKS